MTDTSPAEFEEVVISDNIRTNEQLTCVQFLSAVS